MQTVAQKQCNKYLVMQNLQRVQYGLWEISTVWIM